MSYTITQENFKSFASLYADSNNGLNWQQIFLLPDWLKIWWQTFGATAELYIIAVRQSGTALGIAPLQITGSTAAILGSTDVCDYQDFIVTRGREQDFCNAILDNLSAKKIKLLDLKSLRPDSAALTTLIPLAKERGYEILMEKEEVSLELALPGTWDEYLKMLDTKQRHEIRRKLRRLEEEGDNINYSIIEDKAEIPQAMNAFLKLFVGSRTDKANFLTAQRHSFFRAIAEALANSGILRLGVLKLDSIIVAMVMCFDYNGCRYLYNSGYSPDYRDLSVGIISKVLCIRNGIETGKKKFDFLKGNEAYKYYLGGKEIQLYNCKINIP